LIRPAITLWDHFESHTPTGFGHRTEPYARIQSKGENRENVSDFGCTLDDGWVNKRKTGKSLWQDFSKFGGIYTMNADGSNVTLIDPTSDSAADPDWRP
jgi:hypothetical protein